MIKTEKSVSAGILVRQARDLFWKYGIKRVSVEEICREAGISKMTFYRNFNNKADIATKVLGLTGQAWLDNYVKVMKKDLPFSIKIKNLVKQRKKDLAGISSEFIKDVYQSDDPVIKATIQESNQKNKALLVADLQSAQASGEIREDLNLNYILYLIDDMSLKMQDDRLRQIFKSEDELLVTMIDHFFHGIMSPTSPIVDDDDE